MPFPSPTRVLITGAGGFVGRHLIAALAAWSDAPEIVAGTYGEEASSLLNARTVSLDVTNAEQTLGVIQAERPTHVMHLAGITVVSQANRDVRKTWDVNTQGTLNVALAIKECAPACRLLFCSSAQVYGGSFRSGKPLAEDAPLDPENIYASSKAAADLLIGQMAKDGLRAVRLRPFNHTGPGQPPDLAVASFASQIAAIERGEQEPVMKVGNLSMRREFLDVRDVVDAYVKAIQRFDSLPNGSVFNIASGVAIEVDAILKMLLAMSWKTIDLAQDPQRIRPNDTPVMVGNAEALRRALDWRPRRRVADTLKSVLDYYREPRSKMQTGQADKKKHGA
jgi:GDP-4-dehydro-6-deoxy-D-mannose reductase